MNNLNYSYLAIAGYLVDLYRIARCHFTNPHSYFKFATINAIRKQTKARVFIETGTFLGVTAKRCSRVFETVYTIELDEKLARKAERNLSSKRNVCVIQGEALEELPKLLRKEEINQSIIFLDGHFSGGVTACGDLPEPAVKELEILSPNQGKINAIIVDDFRTFGCETGYPKKSELLKAAETFFPETDYTISVHLDQLIIVRKF